MSRAATPADVLSGAARWACTLGDVRESLRTLPDESVQCVVTSPPYWGLRDYGCAGQIGMEPTPAAYVETLRALFAEVRRVLRGDKHGSPVSASQIDAGPKRTRTGSIPAGSNAKPKDLLGIPWRVAFALQDDGWWLRSDIVWSKPNPMPESVTDRPTRAHEYVFLLTKSARYFYDADAIAEVSTYPGDNRAKRTDTRKVTDPMCADGGSRARTGNPTGETRNARSVWTITPEPYAGAHFATMPPELARRCILAGSRKGDVVLDPFGGSGTTALVAVGHGRRAILCELNEEYAALQRERLAGVDADFSVPVRVAPKAAPVAADPRQLGLFGGDP